MSLKFYFGPSGAGKSRQLYKEINARAGEEISRNFLYIVPDQFTMQTQKDIVSLSDRGGILNIDVLSFSRLSHRILEEVGHKDLPVLDDTGKSLILQSVAEDLKDSLPTLGSLLKRQGYIHEAKSAISEFMQYGLSYENVEELISFSNKRGALSNKLKDLNVLYKGFKDYINDKFITSEETLDVLRRSISKSNILKDSVVIFDGFTGFTPIQYRVIEELLTECSEVIISLVMGLGEDPYKISGDQELFYLSKKTVRDLEKIAEKNRVKREKDVFVKSSTDRFSDAEAIRFLENNLFRNNDKKYEKPAEIHIFETISPSDEAHQTALYVAKQIREKQLEYRDIAVICGDMAGYGALLESEFGKMGIPIYMDKTHSITMNPMVEAIRSALSIFIENYSYEAMFHYLRSGIVDISWDEIDKLENYCLKAGIRGKRKWTNMFTRKDAEASEGDDEKARLRRLEQEEKLKELNQIRENVIKSLEPVNIGNVATAGAYVNALYDFLVNNKTQEKLTEYEEYFKTKGNLSKAKEYNQIYRLIIELLEQINSLLGDKEITIQEFQEILEAGFGEIEVGTIPQNVDRVLVGDMERTRLKQVKTLFFIGVNDGNIPKSLSKGGIISDMDREFLRDSGIELAPSPRQQMFIQRLYLYLNMTKPSRELFISFSKINNEGKSIRPSYLIDTLTKMFDGIKVEYPQNREAIALIERKEAGSKYLAAGIREYVGGLLPKSKEQEFFTIYKAYEGEKNREALLKAALTRYEAGQLSKEIARALYGVRLENSVTRLETFSSCAYRHFLKYGLSLKEREEFGFESVDMGNVYHAVLEEFSNGLAAGGFTWFDFTYEYAEKAIRDCLNSYATTYGDTVLFSSARNAYAVKRMERILLRTVMTLKHQLGAGSFKPDGYEVSFGRVSDIDCVNIALSDEEKMHLSGKIDRVDVDSDDERVYVKVIDYKSGSKQFDIAALYYGLQLQLVLYMNVACAVEKKKHPNKEIVPAAMLYYHIDDPTIETTEKLSDEEINYNIIKELKLTGKVLANKDVVSRLDKTFTSKSDIIPVEIKKDQEFSKRSQILAEEDMQVVSGYVNKKVKEIGQNIIAGNIEINPYEKGGKESCTYCPYKKVCSFDQAIPGFKKRKLDTVDGSKEEEFIIGKMRQELEDFEEQK